MLRYLRCFSIIILLVLISRETPALESIKFGVFSTGSPEVAIKQWSPLLDYLSRKLGIPFEMVMREDYRGMLEALERKEIDVSEGGPRTNLTAIDKGFGRALAQLINFDGPNYHTVILVSAESPLLQLRDLQGKNFALVDELSTFGYLFPRIALYRAEIPNPETFFHHIRLTGSHERSMDAVIDGVVDGAAVLDILYHALPPKKRAKLRVIYQSAPIPSEDLLIRSDIAPAIREKIRTALLNYHANVPIETRRVVMIDRFVPVGKGENSYALIRDDVVLGESLPKLTLGIPYQRTPTVIAERVAAGKRGAVTMIGGIFSLVILLMALSLFALRRRLSAVVAWAIMVIVGILSLIFSTIQLIALFSALDTFAHQTLSRIENLNLRLNATSMEGSAGSLDHILQVATHDSPIRFANLLRNGIVMAAGNPQERGTSIIGRIRAGTFLSLDATTVQIVDPIIIERQRFALLQLGITVTPIDAAVRRAVAINGMAMGIAVGCGIGALLIIRRKLAQRLAVVVSAVNELREGGHASIDTEDAEISPLAHSLRLLGQEMADKEQLLTLTQHDAAPAPPTTDAKVTQELMARFAQMEAHNKTFRQLRHTEALGHAPAYLRCIRDAVIRSKDKDPVLILGPSGSGKTSIARVIHALSVRQSQPIGEFNCGEFASADPLVLLGKLFGYGANSGIVGIEKNGQKGILEDYEGGTLFMDEVGILPMSAQQLLLLPLEGRPFNPAAGKGRAKQVNVRFIFATNEPLDALVERGTMRHDLLRRIQSRGAIHVPSLADRREDIGPLAHYFLGQLNGKQGTACLMTGETLHLLQTHTYPDYNVSELMGIVTQAYDNAVFQESKRITPDHFPDVLKQKLNITSSGSPELFFDMDELKELHILREEGFNVTRAETRLGYAGGAKTLTNRLRGIIYKTLVHTEWNIDAAVCMIIGERTDCLEKIKSKFILYAKHLNRHITGHTTDRLFNNLPQKYHDDLTQALKTADASAQGPKKGGTI